MGRILTESIGFETFEGTRTEIDFSDGAGVGGDAYSIGTGEGCGEDVCEECLDVGS